ncbi:MAG: lipocalin family protein [Candidatus Limimorpha sp.]
MRINKLSKKLLGIGILSAFALTSCNEADIEGRWVEPIPGMENQIQGICLEKGGKASSINMATLLYDSWERNGDILILSGKSIGNKVSSTFIDTLTIQELTKDKLVLNDGETTITYIRK